MLGLTPPRSVSTTSTVQVGSGEWWVDDAYGDGSTNARTHIQGIIDTAEAAGGGIVNIPPGTYIIGQGASASEGGLRFKTASPKVWLRGAGMGVTILKAANNLTVDMTGIVRTTSGLGQSNMMVTDLTIDGNKANQTTNGTYGFYSGASPNASITVTVSGTTGTVTWTNHGFLAGRTISIDSPTQDLMFGDFVIQTVVDANTFTITLPAGLSTESSVRGYNAAIDTKMDKWIHLERLEVKNCKATGSGGYGIDPHEITRYLRVLECVARDNDGPGLALDGCWDTEVIGGDFHNNGSGGVEVYTGSRNITIHGSRVFSNGILGVSLEGNSKRITISGCQIYDNVESGIYGSFAVKENIISNNIIRNNGRHGVHLRSCLRTLVTGNIIQDNSQVTTNTYDGVYLDGGAGASTNVGNIVSNNVFRSVTTAKMRYGVNVQSATVNASIYGNVISEIPSEAMGTGAIENAGIRTMVSSNRTAAGEHPGWVSTRYYPPVRTGAASTLALTLNRVYFMPFFIPAGTRINQTQIEVTVNGSGSGTYRVGLYANTKGVPGDLVSDLGSYTVSSPIGVKTFNHTDIRVAGGWYWFAMVANGPVTLQTVTAQAVDANGRGAALFGLAGPADYDDTTLTPTGWYYDDAGATYVGSGLPATAPTVTAITNAACPVAFMQAA